MCICFDPAIPPPEIYLKEIIKGMQRFNHKNVASKIKICQQPKCQTIGNLLNKRQYSLLMKYYFAIKHIANKYLVTRILIIK